MSERQRLMEEFRTWEKEIFALSEQIIRSRAFAQGKARLAEMLAENPCRDFDVALKLHLSDSDGDIQKTIDALFRTYAAGGNDPAAITGLGIDLSEHAQGGSLEHGYVQGVEINLYSKQCFDFLGSTDAELVAIYSTYGTPWQGGFEDIETADFDGMHDMVALERQHPVQGYERMGVVIENEGPDEQVRRSEVAYARTLANALVAVEFHRFMHDLIPHLRLPHNMVIIVAEHDMLHIPQTHYRAAGAPGWQMEPGPLTGTAQYNQRVRDDARARAAEMAETTRILSEAVESTSEEQLSAAARRILGEDAAAPQPAPGPSDPLSRLSEFARQSASSSAEAVKRAIGPDGLAANPNVKKAQEEATARFSEFAEMAKQSASGLGDTLKHMIGPDGIASNPEVRKAQEQVQAKVTEVADAARQSASELGDSVKRLLGPDGLGSPEMQKAQDDALSKLAEVADAARKSANDFGSAVQRIFGTRKP